MNTRQKEIGIQVNLPEYEEIWGKVSDEEKRWRLLVTKKYFFLSRSTICSDSYITKIYSMYDQNDGKLVAVKIKEDHY